MADLTWRRIAEVLEGDEVVSFTESPGIGQNRIYEKARVERVWTISAEAVEIGVGDRTLVASADHRFLTRIRPYWRQAERLSLQSGLVDIGIPAWRADTGSEPYLAGYLAGAAGGDGTMRIAGSGKNGTRQSYFRLAVLATDRAILERLARAFSAIGVLPPPIRPFDGGQGSLNPATGPRPMQKIETRRMAALVAIRDLALPERDDRDWKAGFLAGFFDTDGSATGGNIRYFGTKRNGLLERTGRCITDLGFTSRLEDFRGSAGRSVRLVGNTEEQIRFLSTIQPALTRKCADFYGRRFLAKHTSNLVSIRRLGRRDLVDIQTTSGTFIANGIAAHNCYAERISHRYGTTTQPWTAAHIGANVVLHPERLEAPLHWRRPRDVFAGSMTDLFGEFVPDAYVAQILAVIALAHTSSFLIITKRAERAAALLGSDHFWDALLAAAVERGGAADEIAALSRSHLIPNLTLAVTVENDRFVGRVEHLRAAPVGRRMVVAEPLLGPLPSLVFAGFDEISVGGESGGPAARSLVTPCPHSGTWRAPATCPRCHGSGWAPKAEALTWVRDLRDRATAAGIAFSLHQWGGPFGGAGGRTLDGQTY
jgi:protein gp37